MLGEVVTIVLVENGLIPSELWTLALETYFGEPAKIENNGLLLQ